MDEPEARLAQENVQPARSALMSRVKGKNTKPEMIVRRAAYALGYRFRLHQRDLPGCPDLVFASRRKVIFVHGCFWHRHEACKMASTPKTRVDFWTKKFETNIRRDRAAIQALEGLGWEVQVVWECETRSAKNIADRLRSFLD